MSKNIGEKKKSIEITTKPTIGYLETYFCVWFVYGEIVEKNVWEKISDKNMICLKHFSSYFFVEVTKKALS